MDLSIVKKLVIDLFRFDFPDVPKADVMTFACDCDRYIDFEGKKYSPLIDSIEDSLAKRGLTSISIARINSEIKGDKAFGKVFSPDGAFARALLTKRLKKLFKRNGYSYSHYEESIWNKLLEQSKAKVVIAITPSRELCQAARKLGIWVADVQHGALSDSHSSYGEAFRNQDPLMWVPNAFLCWDEGAVNTIRKWSNKYNLDLRLIGHPWVDRFRFPEKSDNLVRKMQGSYRLDDNGKKNVFISLQWKGEGIGEDFVHPELENYILKNLDNYNWYFRLHPNMIHGFAKDDGQRFFKYLNRVYPAGKIEWEKATAMPLPLLLTVMDGHMTWSSSVCIEAANFGIPSLLLDVKTLDGGEWEDCFRDLTIQGYVDRFPITYESIDNWLKTRINIKLPLLANYRSNYENLMDEIANRVGSK